MGAFIMLRRIVLSAGLAALCTGALAIAQEAKKQPAKGPTVKAPPAAKSKEGTDKSGLKTESVEVPAPKTGARGEFDKLMEDWKVILKKMRELRTNFQTAKEDEQKKLTEEFNAEVEKGRRLLPKLKDAALAAYVETGSADPQLERFLLKFVADSVDQDNFEEGLAMCKQLFKAGCTEKLLSGAAGICAYAACDFASAEGYFKTANESGIFLVSESELSKLGQQFSPLVEPEKKLWE